MAIAIVLAVRATPATLFADYRLAVPAVIGWACVAAIAPSLAKYEISFLNRGNSSALWLIAAGVLLSLLTLPLSFPGVIVGFFVILLGGRQGLVPNLGASVGVQGLTFAYGLLGLFLAIGLRRRRTTP